MKIGIFGATGAVGKELIKVIYDMKLPFESLSLYASERSAGLEVLLPDGKSEAVSDANAVDYTTLDLAFFAIGGGWPKENAKKATEAGCMVIDNSSTYRLDKNVPLVVPEINPHAIGDSMLIANPNCTTAIAAIPLYVLYKEFGLNRVMISTYQAASGAGAEGMKELEEETRHYLSGEKVGNKVFQYPLPFNVIPHIDVFMENGHTKEEMKVVYETRKIFEDPSIPISCIAVRIPVMRAHSEAFFVQTKKRVTPQEYRELLYQTKGVQVKDDPQNKIYPMPLTASGKYDVEVGRIMSSSVFEDRGLDFFISGDQLNKGAASNAVQIAFELLRTGRLS